MAQIVNLYLKAKGSDIKGESSQVSQGRADSIECYAWDYGVSLQTEGGQGNMATAARKHQPIKIRKKIDKASPLILKALCNFETVDGTFKFFRPHPQGDGTEQQYYTVEFKNGRVSSIKQLSHDIFDPVYTDDRRPPPLEEVEFVFETITCTITDGGVTHSDSWRGK